MPYKLRVSWKYRYIGFIDSPYFRSMKHDYISIQYSINSFFLQGEKLRRRNDWMKWIVPPSMRSSTKLQSVTLDEMGGNSEAYISRTSSGELTSTSQHQSGTETMGTITPQGGQQSAAAGNSSN